MTAPTPKFANSPTKISTRAPLARVRARICAYVHPCHTHIKDKEIEERARGWPVTPPMSSACHWGVILSPFPFSHHWALAYPTEAEAEALEDAWEALCSI